MNIYFCGIGGVGLGPLAEIALDAGHKVQGSDSAESLMTQRLTERGIAVNTKQKGMFLQLQHRQHPIDWFVYSSGIPENHPEMILAKMLGIKMTKRDELLQYIINEKGLKLIAIAGTHGKTTTSAMAVWTMKELGIPISYSVGTTMSFGPSGAYVPGSKYFVYECDEFDRNFLQFKPYLSLITSLDYDHPDTYGSPDDYMTAFRQFINQSESSIVWQYDANLIGKTEHTTTLGEDDLVGVTLVGDHNRHNGSLVVKALGQLGIDSDIVDILNRFPGVDRRFEKLTNNLYTDYGHHPTEIAATLQLARELNDDVVLVYQPHQNLRQHELRTGYVDCLESAKQVFWLPTYLTRENPELPILTPANLIENITNPDIVSIAELDDHLWGEIQKARDRGALVLVMGAGSIDEWARQKIATRHVANVLIMDTEGNFILQKRDDKPGIYDPGQLTGFGGEVEATDASCHEAAVRELREETNLKFDDSDIAYFKMALKTEPDNTPTYVVYYSYTNADISSLEVYEGQGFEKINPNDLNHHNLSIFVRSVITEFTHPAPKL